MFQTPVSPGPWQELPFVVVDILRPGIPQLADEMVEALRVSVPELGIPESVVGRKGTRTLIEGGLGRFLDRIASPVTPLPLHLDLARMLGEAEFHSGRSLDVLQAAYRVAARTMWRRFSTLGMEAGLCSDQLCALAEAVFVVTEEAADQSARSYAALAGQAGVSQQRQRERLLELLIGEGAFPEERIRESAVRAKWRIPDTVACVALDEPWQDHHLLSPAVGPDVLMDLRPPGPFVLVPDPDGPGRLDMLTRAFDSMLISVGPSVPLSQARLSLRLARRALSLARRGLIAAAGPIMSDRHLPTLLIFGDEDVVRLMERGGWDRLAALPPGRRGPLAETLRCYLSRGGSAPDLGARLNVHPQTVRYRMARLEHMYGDSLQDPEWRFRMQIVMHMHEIMGRGGQAG